MFLVGSRWMAKSKLSLKGFELLRECCLILREPDGLDLDAVIELKSVNLGYI